MANTFTLKRSSVARKIPTAAQLSTGELAVNLVDGKLYTENASGAVLTLAESPHELITASEALLAGDWVNVYNNAGTANVRKASASDSTRPMTGFVLEDTAVAALAKVYFSGTNDAVSDLTVGTQYLSASPGRSSTTPPASNVQVVGIAVTLDRVRMLDAGVVQPSAGGGGAGLSYLFTESETPPATPAVGDVWVKSSTGVLYTRVSGLSGSSHWVELGPTN